MDRLTDSLDWFTHGWHAFIGAWLVVLVGLWAGLWMLEVHWVLSAA